MMLTSVNMVGFPAVATDGGSPAAGNLFVEVVLSRSFPG